MTANQPSSQGAGPRRPKVLVLRAPGINCERESYDAFARAGAAPEYVHIKRLREQPQLLDQFSILMVPGGFAYGDDIAAGRVLGNEMRRHLGPQLLGFVDRGGLALGICNGFQVLVRLGLLPRLDPAAGMVEQVSLTWNLSNHYECRWVDLVTPANRCVFLEAGLRFRWPAAHAEGRLWPQDARIATLLRDEGFAAVLYADGEGQPTEGYPANPNGSPGGLAGLTDHSGRVLGVMPHPDRAYLPFHMPDWRRSDPMLVGKGDGMAVFEGMVAVARAEA